LNNKNSVLKQAKHKLDCRFSKKSKTNLTEFTRAKLAQNFQFLKNVFETLDKTNHSLSHPNFSCT